MKRAILALFLATPLLGQPAPAPPKPVQWPPITEKKLENGLTVVLVPLHNVPKVECDLTFLVGRGTAYKEKPGVAQLAARVLSEGTATRSSKQIKEELRAIGGDLNVNADVDATTIASSALSDFTPKLFDIVSDVAQHAAYPKSEVDLAKANLANEIEEERSQPDFLAQEQLAKALFGSHPYGFTVPDTKALPKVTRESLKEFAAARYVPNDAVLIVVGDIEPDTAFAEVKKAFGGWKRGAAAPAVTAAFPKREKRTIYFVDRPGSVQSTIYFGAVAPPRKSPDYIALRTADTIFGGSFYSRLTRNIREAKGYTYSPGSSAFLRRLAGEETVSASVRNEVTGPTLLEIFYELDRMRVEPVTKEELDAAKTYSNGTMALELESQAGFASRIRTLYVYDLPRDFLKTFSEKINALTPADIQKAAAKYFDTYRGAVVVVGDYKQVASQVAPFGDVVMVK
ncbi:MAG TPA: pitrilysin family protein [Thermoanaerobaculia bacterium]|nr:pitrilysin family protein [Thermoanaerobaculia bacterium]